MTSFVSFYKLHISFVTSFVLMGDPCWWLDLGLKDLLLLIALNLWFLKKGLDTFWVNSFQVQKGNYIIWNCTYTEIWFCFFQSEENVPDKMGRKGWLWWGCIKLGSLLLLEDEEAWLWLKCKVKSAILGKLSVHKWHEIDFFSFLVGLKSSAILYFDDLGLDSFCGFCSGWLCSKCFLSPLALLKGL